MSAGSPPAAVFASIRHKRRMGFAGSLFAVRSRLGKSRVGIRMVWSKVHLNIQTRDTINMHDMKLMLLYYTQESPLIPETALSYDE